MRPIKLVMSAFGPYAKTQSIDFRDATDAGLFGIYGPTGSGKSSIFSAMTFALFGEAAKKEQPISSLRSAHAPAELLTEVGFVFELGAKRYLVRRQPEQSRPKARGDGETDHKHAAWLFDVTDIEIDAIDFDGCGNVVAERKVGQVNEHIRSILGYGAEQFRQIVLLPQGRFEKFLTSDSSERLKILRELFDVSLYRLIAERLKEEASAALRDVKDGYRVHAQRLLAEGFDSSDDLETGIEDAKRKTSEAKEESAAKEQEASKAETANIAAQGIEQRFVEAEGAERTLKALNARGDEMALTRARRDNALLAQRASDRAEAIMTAEAQLVKVSYKVGSAAEAKVQVDEKLASAQTSLAEEQGKADKFEALQRELADLDRYKKALVDAADLKSDLDQKDAAQVEARQARDDAQSELERLIELHTQAQNAISAAQADAVERGRLQNERSGISADLKNAKAHAKAIEVLTKAQNTTEKAEVARVEADAAHAKARAEFEGAEKAYLSAQASILANRLKDGEPCPVCGASEHPQPAHAGDDPSELGDAWKQAQSDLSDAANILQHALVDHGAAVSLLREKEAAFAELERPEIAEDHLAEALVQIDEALYTLGEVREIAALQDALVGAKKQLELSVAAKDGAEGGLQGAITQAAVAQRSYENQISDVPERYRDKEDLEESRTAVEKSIDARRELLADAEKSARIANEVAATAAADLRNAETRKAEADREVERAREQFASRLAELKITETQYDAFVDGVGEIEALTQRVSEFESALREAKGAAVQAAAALKGVERPDLPTLLTLRNEAQTSANDAKSAAATTTAKYDGLASLRDELAGDLARLRKLEEETGPLRTLAEAFSGQNEMNTTLESFAIGAMFDQVLEAANLRLEPMTEGRYSLERDGESVGGQAKRGLDIRVHDIETGRPRDLTTLSGGETFIAALSLALGLSDIVESSHGAIRLDTIFIDEGFGSLDTENDSGTLDRILQVLQDIVGASRAVGLISHVPLVQQIVPVGFTILKGAGGSSIEKRAA